MIDVNDRAKDRSKDKDRIDKRMFDQQLNDSKGRTGVRTNRKEAPGRKETEFYRSE